MPDAISSGVEGMLDGDSDDYNLMILDSGDSSVALMHVNPEDSLKLIDQGWKHAYGIPYFVNTYVGFTAQKPR